MDCFCANKLWKWDLPAIYRHWNWVRVAHAWQFSANFLLYFYLFFFCVHLIDCSGGKLRADTADQSCPFHFISKSYYDDQTAINKMLDNDNNDWTVKCVSLPIDHTSMLSIMDGYVERRILHNNKYNCRHCSS